MEITGLVNIAPVANNDTGVDEGESSNIDLATDHPGRVPMIGTASNSMDT
ncbi:MAG: hypothetical protein HN348_00475 [Proteobacteria bacterium]|nr:hypothetical protein [Pseudomonadota bacterium]